MLIGGWSMKSKESQVATQVRLNRKRCIASTLTAKSRFRGLL